MRIPRVRKPPSDHNPFLLQR